MGQLVGGVFGVFLMYFVWEWTLFMRIMDDPMRGKISSAVAGYLSASILDGFATANGGPFVFDGFLVYSLGGMVVFAYAWTKANKLKEKPDDVDAFS